jgi:hypothetical protein
MPSSYELCKNARILVAVTFHFKEARLRHLAQTLRAMSSWDVDYMRVVVFTNEQTELNSSKLKRLCSEILCNRESEIRVVTGLDNPLKLTWAHKPLIKSDFLNENHAFSHFIYIEDDIEIFSENCAYWLAAREILRPKGLIPSFLRLEYEPSQAALTSSDSFWRIFVPSQSYLKINNIIWLFMPNPYNPLYILDQELAREYVESRSFDEIQSAEVCSWGLTERAAMALCNEGIPECFPHRYVVPLNDLGIPPVGCQIFHIPSNYAANPHSALGKVRLDTLFNGVNMLKPKDEVCVLSSHACDATLSSGDLNTSRDVQTRDIADHDWTKIIDLLAINPHISSGVVLVSHHDTILFYDFKEHSIRQEPFGIAPFNLIFLSRDENTEICAIDDDGKISIVDWGGAVGTSESKTSRAEKLFYRDGTFSFSNDKKFLSARLNGSVGWNAELCHQFERFRLLRVDTLLGLAWLRRADWLDENGDILTWHDQPLDFGRQLHSEGSALAATIEKQALASRRALKVGTSQIFLAAPNHQFFFLDKADTPTTLRIVELGGADRRVTRIVPDSLTGS